MATAHPNWWFVTASFFIGQAIQSVFLIFLTIELFFKRNSKLKQAYYHILYITYVLDTLDNIAWLYDELAKYEIGNVGVAVAQLYIWYYIYSIGTWSFLLSINRFTAVAYPLIHTKFWSGKQLYIIFGITALVPFFINGYSFANIYCRLYAIAPECQSFKRNDVFMQTISNIIFSIASLIIVTIAIMKAPKISNALAKIERKSIIYTVTTSILVMAYSITFYMCRLISPTPEILYNVAALCFCCHQYIPMLSLLILNPMFRQEFFKFLKLDRVGIVKNRVSSVAAATTTVKHSPYTLTAAM